MTGKKERAFLHYQINRAMPKYPSFILSDDTVVNNQGFRLITAGGDLNQFKKNPVMFYKHKEEMLPIGMWENIRVEGNVILADPVFDEDDEFAMQVAGKVEKGFIKMASIGAWPPEELSNDPKDKLPGQKLPTVTKWRAREASIVPIGANNNAMTVRLYDNDGNLTSDLLKLCDHIINPKKQLNMSKLTKMLKLKDDASEDVIEQAVIALADENEQLAEAKTKLETENTQLKDAAKAVQQAGIIALVDKAVEEKRIGADLKDTYVKLAEVDFDGTKKVLDSLPKVNKVMDNIETEGFVLTDEQKSWTMRDWDKKGMALKLKDGNAELYKKLYVEEYGKEPKA